MHLELPLTSRGRVALAIARALAAGRGDPDVTPTHLALGLLREGENGAVALLDFRGRLSPTLRKALEEALGPITGRPLPGQVVVPLTPGEEGLVAQARVEAEVHGHGYIGPEHLLLAILRDENSHAAKVFATQGIDVASVAGLVREVIHTHPSSKPSSEAAG